MEANINRNQEANPTILTQQKSTPQPQNPTLPTSKSIIIPQVTFLLHQFLKSPHPSP